MARRRKDTAPGCELLGDRCLLSAGGFATASGAPPTARATRTTAPLAPDFEPMGCVNFDDLRIVKHLDRATAPNGD
jgi:hypothetical protein